MLTEYVQAAMKHAHYEIMEDGRYWGEVPELEGVWADGDTLEKCRETLREVIEGWLIVGFRHGDPVPVIDDINLNAKVKTEAA